MANRFRDPYLARQYAAALEAFRTKNRDLFDAAGTRRAPGCSFASFFWRGFDGTRVGGGFTDRASRSTPAYAYYRAGQDCAAATRSGRCAHCGQRQGDHRAGSLNCPTGMRTRVGWTSFHRTEAFTIIAPPSRSNPPPPPGVEGRAAP